MMRNVCAIGLARSTNASVTEWAPSRGYGIPLSYIAVYYTDSCLQPQPRLGWHNNGFGSIILLLAIYLASPRHHMHPVLILYTQFKNAYIILKWRGHAGSIILQYLIIYTTN